MPIVASDLLEVAPSNTYSIAEVGDYIVSFNYPISVPGVMPNGSYVVFDTLTETSRAFTGLPTTAGAASSPNSMAVGHAGYAWINVWGGDTLYRVDPVTGGLTTFATPGGDNRNGPIIGIGDYILNFRSGNSFESGSRQFRISTSTSSGVTEFFSGYGGHVACSDGYVYINSGTSWAKVDPSTVSTVATFTGPAVLETRGVEYGGYLWFAGTSVIARLDTTALTFVTYSHAGVPGGNAGGNTNLVAHTDGWLYCYGEAGDVLIGFHPPTGTFGKEALVPTRGRRHNITSVNGKLWIPSGEPR